jgi:hypothetical protein
MKALLIIACVLAGLFLLSLVVYFFNLDMKLSASLEPFMRKHYGKVKRDRRL